ncbi:protein FAR1-RELATED SEQUENCE 5-like [Aegilops tauschii subsp. strangulata]|uniref:protein FAR1-RELATED SEQUENCE 5-like n=1 Tax=Aegilops tauschii subsp. strangulata TaxID=200361 RepID=UPI001ABCAFFE|nr:protein FAR-RED IMPAIRED RESPONSE 1-like [Aegilops tauschii subsp. strangulata]
MMIDLNEPPLDVESINISVELGVPFLHAGGEQGHQQLEEEVGESPDPNIGSNTTHVPDKRVATPPPMVAPANALVHEARELEDEEAGSQPQQPYVGMRFDTLEDAREHYNRYALMEGFSIKSNTSYRSAYTGVVEKQQFCCNKFRKPVERVGIPDVSSSSKNTTCPSSPEQDVEDDVEEHTFKKKRKRETVKRTKCRAKMVVKLKDDRWEVITFIADHNHPLIEKPSLSKYLRSHQGIPPEQKKLLTHLNDCNLTAGKMMMLMSSYYGSELIVPYTAKAIHNHCSKLNAPTKDIDIEETLN